MQHREISHACEKNATQHTYARSRLSFEQVKSTLTCLPNFDHGCCPLLGFPRTEWTCSILEMCSAEFCDSIDDLTHLDMSNFPSVVRKRISTALGEKTAAKAHAPPAPANMQSRVPDPSSPAVADSAPAPRCTAAPTETHVDVSPGFHHVLNVQVPVLLKCLLACLATSRPLVNVCACVQVDVKGKTEMLRLAGPA